ncbi:MAG: hypothetical protein N4A74_17860 [Carboxylicivirga sp.]|jgi:Holliday junction resolvase RusA-like endonuclease|nr:hypothetical protein [Carboxylicivirga sp.]
MANKIKPWRLNVFVDYYDQQTANSYRFNTLELFKHLASIYKIDYSISIEHQFSIDNDSSEKTENKIICDLIYFRSNKYSRIERKDLRAAIDNMFKTVPSPFIEGVDIDTQLYKMLKKFPFPTDFYRPLNYPWIEHHSNSKKKLLIYHDEVMKVIENEQDFTQN